ncbi:hypothetical protein KUCAC02_014977, partial [Chaenocephalus aceratus]
VPGCELVQLRRLVITQREELQTGEGVKVQLISRTARQPDAILQLTEQKENNG